MSVNRAQIDPGSPTASRRRAFFTILGFWTFYYLVNTARTALMHGILTPALLPRGIVTLAGIGLSSLLYAILRPLDGRAIRWRLTVAFAASVPVTCAYSTANYYVFHVYDPSPWPMEHMASTTGQTPTLAAVAETAADWYFFIAAWAVLYIALSNADQVQLAERRAAEYKAEAQAAQLRALRYQINPHFLFNTLNALSTLALRNGNDEADRIIVALATFLRMTLSLDPGHDVSLSEELRLQALYLQIEQVRFPDRLRVDMHVPAELRDAQVPSLLLQPLIENAVKHGLAPTSRMLTITIRAAHQDDDRLRLTVRDDGVGLQAPPTGLGVGLRNVRERLHARYDGLASCNSGPLPAGGFQVVLILPLLKA